MYDNIGTKIKVYAKVLTIIDIVSFSSIGVVTLILFNPFLGLVIIGIGVLISWASNFLLYGIGQLIGNSDRQTELQMAILKKLEDLEKNNTKTKYIIANEVKENINNIVEENKNNDSELLSIEYESNEIKIMDNTIKFCFGNSLTFDKILAIKSQGQYIIIETGSMKYVIKCKSYNEAKEIKNLLPIIK